MSAPESAGRRGIADVGRSPLGAGLITAGLFGLTYVAAVHTGVGRELDQSALLAKSAVIEISPIAVEIVDIVPVAAVALVLSAVILTRGGWRLGAAVAALVAGASAAALLLARTLPQVVEGLPSYPSGHATLSMAMACALVLVATPGWRRPLATVGGGLAIIVGLGLIEIGWHRPAEIAAGYLLAFAFACFLLVALHHGRSVALPDSEADAAPPPPARSVTIVAVIVISLLAAASIATGLADALEHDEIADWVAFALSEIVLIALALGLTHWLANLVEPAARGPR